MPIDSLVIKIFFLTFLSFIIAVGWTPLLTHFLYKYKLGKQIRGSDNAPIFSQMHQKKSGTPVMGGMLVWVTTLVLALVFYFFSQWFDGVFSGLNFLTRSQTLLPLGALVATAIAGLIDDYLNVRKIGPYGGGLSMKHRLIVYMIIAVGVAWWFYYKLQWDFIRLPFIDNFNIGLWYIPFVIFVVIATAFSVNEIDGLDGLAGGTLLAAFIAYGAIAFVQGRYDLAAFCGVIVGSLLAFLWFNIAPARFFMGDTGAMALGVVLAIIALLTNAVLLLPVIGFLFVVESLSVIIQMISKKFRHGKKIFLSTPIHHHFEAIGWPETKVVMRFWVISAITAIIGLVVFLMDKGAWKA
ncbi:phospho-N-acetylmuramoyl-pentapeptide-transferase [Candidatus Falkowbacteria bacterium]|nr:phospho-N-acetylmuramoyl-pentapeptide-transferase [Candidatus Falkowbacteria bacterium]